MKNGRFRLCKNYTFIAVVFTHSKFLRGRFDLSSPHAWFTPFRYTDILRDYSRHRLLQMSIN